MRMYDRMIKYGVDVPEKLWIDPASWDQSGSERESIRSAVVVVADDVAEQYYEGDLWKINGPRIHAPIYPNLFVEANVPSGTSEKFIGQIGMMFSSTDLSAEDDPTQSALDALAAFRAGVAGLSGFADVVSPLRWIIRTSLFARRPDLHNIPAVSGPLYSSMFAVDEDGGLGRTSDGTPLHVLINESGDPDQARHFMTNFGLFFAHVTHLLNCKNIGLEDMPMIRQERRERKRQGLGEVKFKTLTINPSKTQLVRAVTGNHKSTASTRLHLARGNFATYSEDKPLFGKYTGTFWRPAHVRGSADVGTVYKDYKVKP